MSDCVCEGFFGACVHSGPPCTTHAACRSADNGSAFLVHAVVCATVYILSCLTGQLQFYGAAFLMWELSTPFMYARWLLLKALPAPGQGPSREAMENACVRARVHRGVLRSRSLCLRVRARC